MDTSDLDPQRRGQPGIASVTMATLAIYRSYFSRNWKIMFCLGNNVHQKSIKTQNAKTVFDSECFTLWLEPRTDYEKKT